MQQFLVPQFIDVEDKIIGPITTRQFILLLIGVLISAIFYKLFSFFVFIGLGLLNLGFWAVIAFAKINARPIHFFLLNFAQTIKKPNRRVWNKEAYLREVRLVKSDIKEKSKELSTKKIVTSSRLSDLSLTINTGGVYEGEEVVNKKFE